MLQYNIYKFLIFGYSKLVPKFILPIICPRPLDYFSTIIISKVLCVNFHNNKGTKGKYHGNSYSWNYKSIFEEKKEDQKSRKLYKQCVWKWEDVFFHPQFLLWEFVSYPEFFFLVRLLAQIHNFFNMGFVQVCPPVENFAPRLLYRRWVPRKSTQRLLLIQPEVSPPVSYYK